MYLATRHFAGWYMVNVLEMSSEDVAIALGHQDGGNLVRRLYGQPRQEPGARSDRGRVCDARGREPSQAKPIIAVRVSAEPHLRNTYVRQKY